MRGASMASFLSAAETPDRDDEEESPEVTCADCGALLGTYPLGTYADCEECGGFTLARWVRGPDGPSEDDIASSEAAQADATQREHLTAALAEAEKERDEARDLAARLAALADRRGRFIDGAMTFDDAMQAYAKVMISASPDVENCIEWHGDIRGRTFSLSIQWLDGKSPQALLAGAMADRDAAIASLAALTAAVLEERAAQEASDEADMEYESGIGSFDAHHAALAVAVDHAARVTTLLSGASADAVRGDVVRAYLAAVDECGVTPDGPVSTVLRWRRGTLDAALAAASLVKGPE